MIADLLQRAAVIYFHFNSDADSRGGERHSAIRHAEPFPWWRFYMTYSKLVFWLLWGIEINLPVPYSGLILTIEKV